MPRSKGYKGTHILGYFVSLLISNVFQSSGTVMNARWLSLNSVYQTDFCAVQGNPATTPLHHHLTCPTLQAPSNKLETLVTPFGL